MYIYIYIYKYILYIYIHSNSNYEKVGSALIWLKLACFENLM